MMQLNFFTLIFLLGSLFCSSALRAQPNYFRPIGDAGGNWMYITGTTELPDKSGFLLGGTFQKSLELGGFSLEADTYGAFIAGTDSLGSVKFAMKVHNSQSFPRKMIMDEQGNTYYIKTDHVRDSAGRFLQQNSLEKLDVYGNKLWGDSLGWMAHGQISLKRDRDGNLWVAPVVIDTRWKDTVKGFIDTFIVKLSTKDKILDTIKLSGHDCILGLEVDDLGQVYAAGAEVDATGRYKMWLAKYHAGGGLAWKQYPLEYTSTSWIGTYEETGFLRHGRGLYFCGWAKDSFKVLQQMHQPDKIEAARGHSFILSYDTSGTPVWIRTRRDSVEFSSVYLTAMEGKIYWLRAGDRCARTVGGKMQCFSEAQRGLFFASINPGGTYDSLVALAKGRSYPAGLFVDHKRGFTVIGMAFALQLFPYGELNADQAFLLKYVGNRSSGMPEEVQATFTVYPNPATTGSYLEMKNGQALPPNSYIILADLKGRELLRMPAPDAAKVWVPFSGLQPGIYLCRISSGGTLLPGAVKIAVQ